MPSSHSSGEVNGEDVVGTDSDDSDEEYKDDDVEEMDEGWTDEVWDERTPQAFRPVPLSPVAAAALAACESPLDYFYLIIPPSFISHMVEQTNHLYAEQRAEQAKDNRTRLRSQARGSAHTSWDAVTDPEMLAFLGCLCYMGDVKIANVRDYWEATYYQPFVADRFPRDRFMALLRSFHLNDNRTTPHTSTSRSLHKIQPLVDVVRKQSQRAYSPGDTRSG